MAYDPTTLLQMSDTQHNIGTLATVLREMADDGQHEIALIISPEGAYQIAELLELGLQVKEGFYQ